MDHKKLRMQQGCSISRQIINNNSHITTVCRNIKDPGKKYGSEFTGQRHS